MTPALRTLCLAALFAFPVSTAAFSPRDNWPCTDEMTKRAAAADAVLAKALGAPVAGTCSCTFDDCRSGKVVHAVTLPATGRLALTLTLSQSLSAPPPPLPVLPAVERLSAAAARVAAHPPLAALLTDADGACDVTLNGAAPRFDFNFDCRVGKWKLSVSEMPVPQSPDARRFLRFQFFLPLAVLDSDPEVAIARKHPSVARFLKGKKDVEATYSPNSPRRLVLTQGVVADKYGIKSPKDAFTVFFKTANNDNGWDVETTGVKAACKGVQFDRCL